MYPTEEQLKEITNLVNSRGFLSAVLGGLLAGVLYLVLIPVQAIPTKLDTIISKLDQCLNHRLAKGQTYEKNPHSTFHSPILK